MSLIMTHPQTCLRQVCLYYWQVTKLTKDALALGVDDTTWQQMKVIFTILNYYSVPCIIASLQHKLLDSTHR